MKLQIPFLSFWVFLLCVSDFHERHPDGLVVWDPIETFNRNCGKFVSRLAKIDAFPRTISAADVVEAHFFDDVGRWLLQVPTFLQGDVLVLPLLSFKPVIFEKLIAQTHIQAWQMKL